MLRVLRDVIEFEKETNASFHIDYERELTFRVAVSFQLPNLFFAHHIFIHYFKSLAG